MYIDKCKQALLFKENYQYMDMGHINDTPTNLSTVNSRPP